MKCVGGKQKGGVLKEAVHQPHNSKALCGPDTWMKCPQPRD